MLTTPNSNAFEMHTTAAQTMAHSAPLRHRPVVVVSKGLWVVYILISTHHLAKQLAALTDKAH